MFSVRSASGFAQLEDFVWEYKRMGMMISLSLSLLLLLILRGGGAAGLKGRKNNTKAESNAVSCG